MKKLVWTIVIAFGLALLPPGGSAFAGQDQVKLAHKTTAKAGKTGKHHGQKHHGKKHHNKPAGENLKHK